MKPVPILLYHSVSDHPSPTIADFTISPSTFSRHLETIAENAASVLTVSEYVAAREGHVLPDRPVIITFDDGYADFYDHALPALEAAGLRSTLYVTTGFLEGRPGLRVEHRPRDRLLSWSQLHELIDRGVEIGAHSHSHFQLDTLNRPAAWYEITRCKTLLEDELQAPVSTFAYPHGHASPMLRRLVREAGYTSACGVRNAFSSEVDDVFLLARLTVLTDTREPDLSAWVDGVGAPIAPRRELARTRLYRTFRRARSLITGRPGSAFSSECV